MPRDGGAPRYGPGHATSAAGTTVAATTADDPARSPAAGVNPARLGSHRAARRARRAGPALALFVAVSAVAVGVTMLGGGLLGALGGGGPSALQVSPMVSDPASAGGSPTPLSSASTASPAPTAGSPTSSPSPTPVAVTASSAAARPSSSAARSASRSSTSAPASAAPTAPVAAGGASAQQVLTQLNQARAGAGLPALTMSAGLVASATKHTQLMAAGCGLSHQCSGEAALGTRISAEGVSWTSVGENIGEGGPVAATDSAVVAMAESLTASMLAETAPNDGHRRNILSSSFHHVGISLYRDAGGTVWMTQDFSG